MTALDAQIERREFGRLKYTQPRSNSRHRTVPLALSGRFMRPDKSEHPAKLIDISVAHTTLSSPIELTHGEKVIAYFEHIGGLEGTVNNLFEGGFAMCLNITTRKREKLAAQLTWLINRSEFVGLEERKHQRFEVGNQTVSMRIGDKSAECKLLDISLSGASLGTSARPTIGTEVVVGVQRAIVRRHHEQGIGVQFLQVQEAKALQNYLG